MRIGQFLFTILIALVLLALIGIVNWNTVGDWALIMLFLALLGPILLIITYLVLKVKDNSETINRRLGVFFNWVIMGLGFLAFVIIIVSISSSNSNFSTSNTNLSNETPPNFVKPGLYIGLYSGIEQGGPERHPWLVEYLSEFRIFNRFNIWCIQGPNRTQNSSAEIEKYRKHNPRYTIIQNCEESSEVLMGPLSNKASMINFFNYHKMGDIDLHLHEMFYECNYTCEEITY